MEPLPLNSFVHPHKVYKLEYPAHWEQITEKDGESCGFGPHDRNDVGLWISVMPMRIDSDRLAEDLPKLMEQSLQKTGAENLRRAPNLNHHALVADMSKEGQGGHYWIVAGADVVLFASSQVPIAERDVWNPPFQKVMESLEITRDLEHLENKLVYEVVEMLRKRYPDQEFIYEDGKLRGPNQVIYLSNLLREVQSDPKRRAKIVKHFVDNLSHPDTSEIGHEEWNDVQYRVLPMLKPRNYINPDSPTQHLLTQEWLGDVLMCYVIKSKKMFRFVTDWDVRRWGIDATILHERCLTNLKNLSWPRELVGARMKDSGRVIVVDCEDGLASSRLLHPNLYQLFSGPLGTPFWAGIPCRERLVLFSDRKALKLKIGRRLSKDHNTSAYPITAKPFLVTRDGIAPPVKA